jgi:hypothetical protein
MEWTQWMVCYLLAKVVEANRAPKEKQVSDPVCGAAVDVVLEVGQNEQNEHGTGVQLQTWQRVRTELLHMFDVEAVQVLRAHAWFIDSRFLPVSFRAQTTDNRRGQPAQEPHTSKNRRLANCPHKTQSTRR